MPTLNQAGYIERAILSILRQNYGGKLQVIVADGGSTDNTVDILKRYPKITWWSRPDNGALDAVFKALAVATGEIITLLPGDDFYLRDAFRKALPFLLQHPEYDFVSGSFVMLQENGRDVILTDKQSCRVSSPLAYVSGAAAIPLQATFLRRSAYDGVGGFRREAEQCCDADLIYRMLHFSRGIVIPEYLSVFQLRPGQKTRINPQEWISSLRKMIEYCERDEKYAKVFTLPAAMKREVDLKNQIFWNNYAGGSAGQERARNLAREILSQRQLYSRELLGFAQSLLPASREGLGKRMVASVIDGSIARKIRARCVHKLDTLRLDLDWWRA
jgi:glycosyltransferase involved in cell wall biosynthesis